VYGFISIQTKCRTNIQGKNHDAYHGNKFSSFGAICRIGYRKNEKL